MSFGCGGDLFSRSVATVQVFATRAGTPGADQQFPDYGGKGSIRVFMNDMGWEIALSEVYVTTAEVELIACNDTTTAIEMFWGPCPENFIVGDDRDTVPLGAVSVDEGSYCGLDVVFAPYLIVPEAEKHLSPDNPEVEGHTIFIRGTARRGMGDELIEVPFEIRSMAEVTAELDISEVENGAPFRLKDENFPRNLTVLKTYDSFFSGVDFLTAGQQELEAAVLSALEFDTRAISGSSV